jgi:predicted patatin/cPLA2 family phospholipase
MDYKATIVLEGGANRGVFTAGLLHQLMDQNLYFTNIVGVSAGSCNGVDYASHQKTRSRDCFIITDKKNAWLHKVNLLKRKSVMDMDKMFDEFPNEIFPYDEEALHNYGLSCDVVATNCLTGKAEYIDFNNYPHKMDLCRASCSMPFVTPMVYLDGVPYLDGGLADAIPLDHAYDIGNEKIVVVLTRQKGYRKTPSSKVLIKFIEKKFKKYPNLVETEISRIERYNKRLDEIDKAEADGKILVIRPEVTPVSRMETNVEKLTFFYNHGYSLMESKTEELKEFLEK